MSEDELAGETPSEPEQGAVDVVLCIDHDGLVRLRPVIRYLCVGFVDLNARVRIVTRSPESVSLASLGPIEVLSHEALVGPMFRRRLSKLVEALSSRPPTVVYAMSSSTFVLGASLAEAFDVDLVLQVAALRDVDALDAIARDKTIHVIAASEPLLQLVQQRRDIRPDRCRLVRPGVLRGSEPTSFRDADSVPSLVCTSRLDDRSGVDVVVEASALVRDHGHTMMTFLLGEGGRETALRQRVRSRDLQSRVTFARPSGDMVEVLRGADMFVLPPGDEDISARPLQAMASGTAVICFSGGMADCFHDGETALVCRERTAEALAAAIEQLLGDHEFARRLGRGAVEYVNRCHQMSRMAELTMGMFRRATLRRTMFRIPP